jgi:hypothetical protein
MSNITIDKTMFRWYRLLTKQNKKLVLAIKIKVLLCVVKENKNVDLAFNAPMVHDFTWAADKIIFMILQKHLGLIFISCTKTKFVQTGRIYSQKTVQLMEILVGDIRTNNIPVIQGGDGGMEYAMYVDFGQGTFEGFGCNRSRNGAFGSSMWLQMNQLRLDG